MNVLVTEHELTRAVCQHGSHKAQILQRDRWHYRMTKLHLHSLRKRQVQYLQR